MEAAAMAHVAQSYACDFVAIRTISDRIGEESQIEDFNHFVYQSALKAGALMVEVLQSYDA
jgi:nucleoside phosphorylase